MKVRTTFVSNSSTSSYVCNICGHTETSWDSVDLEDFGMAQCPMEHIICCECTEIKSSAHDEDGYYPKELCPICQFKEPSNSDIARYFQKIYNISRDEVFMKVKQINRKRKKLYDSEYVTHVATEKSIDIYKLLEELKKTYGTYDKFNEFIWSK